MTLLPFYINYLGDNWTAASQCASGGSNSWFNNHLALNGDLNEYVKAPSPCVENDAS
jgi:phospholipase C